MLPVSTLSDMELAAALDDSACLGAWSYDAASDRFAVSRALSDALGLDAASAPLSRVVRAIHDEDAARVDALFAASRETGGPFEAEFRTSGPAPRWLRLMGRTESGGLSARARGLAFDLTEGRIGATRQEGGAHWQANQLAEHVIAMQGLIPPLGNASLARLVDRLALEVGFELARHLRQAETVRH